MMDQCDKSPIVVDLHSPDNIFDKSIWCN